MVTPASREQIVAHLKRNFAISERRAYALAGVSRTGYRYKAKASNDEALRARLLALATKHSSYGYLFLHRLLRNEGLVKNKKRKKLKRARMPLVVPSASNERWSMGLVSDQLSNGRRFRVLNVIDDYSREMVGQLTDVSIGGRQVGRFLDSLIEQRGRPNQNWFRPIEDADREITIWREHYNTVRPHSSLNYLTPVAFANQAA